MWDTFESSSEGCGEATAVRVAYHLGNNHPYLAKISAYKCSIVGMAIAFFFTSLLFMCGENLPSWFTVDPTLQAIIFDLIPLLGIGNIAMTYGIMSWYILGGQARFGLAATIYVGTTLLISLPLAAVSIYILHLDIKGVVASEIAGYITGGTILAIIIVISDWPEHSRRVIARAAECGSVSSSSSESINSERNATEVIMASA